MEVNIHTENEITVIEMAGDLNSDTANHAYNEIVNNLGTPQRVVLDMQRVPYMSSAGIRTLLLIYRSVKNSGGKIILTGLSEDLQDTLSLTGFLEFFDTQASLDAGIRALR